MENVGGNGRQDRLKQIAEELIRLYRRQLTLWVLGKIDNLNEADLRKYDRRQRRIEQLRRELELIAEYGTELHSA
jgi:predicted DNA-binding protein with PD1-like motif